MLNRIVIFIASLFQSSKRHYNFDMSVFGFSFASSCFLKKYKYHSPDIIGAPGISQVIKIELRSRLPDGGNELPTLKNALCI